MTRESSTRLYTLWRALPSGQVISVGGWAIEANARSHQRSAFRYYASYVDAGHGNIDPNGLKLHSEGEEFKGPGIPAMIEELLPGHWERAVMKRYWRTRNLPMDPANLHDLLQNDRNTFGIGALAISPLNSAYPPAVTWGVSIEELGQLVSAAHQIEQPDLDAVTEAIARLYAGSSVDGARPKALVYDDQKAYIAKFGRDEDTMDYVRVEYACLQLAARAGLAVPPARVTRVNGREVLLVERFDVTPAGGRYHMLSANALLKDPQTRENTPFPRYESLAELVCAYSNQVSEDLRQLYGQMLFNRVINNCDDHLFNFSFIETDRGWQLTPAYDLVPSLAAGADHVTGWRTRTSPPRLDQAEQAASDFHLTRSEARRIIQRVGEAGRHWEKVFAESGVSETDRGRLARYFEPVGPEPAGPAP